jgi:hypothetical protein
VRFVRLAWLPETAQAVFTAVGKIQTFGLAGLRLSPRKGSSRAVPYVCVAAWACARLGGDSDDNFVFFARDLRVLRTEKIAEVPI